MKNIIKFLLITLFAIPSFGQSISIFDIDTTNFPTMKAKFYAFDKDGKQQLPSVSELKITENGINRTIKNVSCPNIPPYTLSVGIMVDTYGKIDLARKGVQKLVDFLYLPQDEIGITYMAGGVYIYQDFTKNKQKASASASLIPSAPGVDINAMFYSQYTGGVPFIKERKSDKKILILLSDLHCPNLNINETNLITDAKANNISIYSVLLGSNDYTGLFNRIAKGTSGKVFERVSNENQITNIFQEIERIERNEPCEIEWISESSCNSLKTIVELLKQEVKTSSSYVTPNYSNTLLKVSPNTISFGKRQPLTQNDTTIILTAQNADYVVNRFNIKYGSSDFTIVNTVFPLNIPKNTSQEITIRFTLSDSSMKYASFEIETDKCLAYFSAYGGFTGKKLKVTNSSLKLTYPNGGEVFNVGSDTLITWEGVSPNDTVTLEYSLNNGTFWKLITKQATNLIYSWNKIPLPISEKCLIRITQLNKNMNNIDSIITLSKFNTPVRGTAFSKDGEQVATASGDATAKIWNSNTGEEIMTMIGHKQEIFCLTYSPDGKRLATGSSDKTAKIWDINSGVEIRTLKGHTQNILGIAYSSDGGRIATASSDKTAKIWDSNTGAEIRTLIGHTDNVNSIAFSQDMSQVATACRDGSVKIWDLNNGNELKTIAINGNTNSVNSIAYSSDKNQIVTASNDNTAKIWDAKTGDLVRTFFGHVYFIYGVSYSPDGNQIATASADGTAKIWDVNTGFILRTLIGHTENVHSIVYSPDGSKLVTGSGDKTAKIWTISDSPLQQDISDSAFSIVAPEAKFSKINIDMGKVVLGQNKDTLITAVFCNTGAAPLHVMGVDVTNGNISDFMVPRGAGEFYLQPNECRDLMFDFMPTSLGIRNAKITVKSTIGDFIDTINITGEGIDQQLEIINNLIDFGAIYVGQFKDTIQVVTIKNVGSSDLAINNSLHLGPNDIEFTTLSGSAPFSLMAGETAKMNLRFAPNSSGRTSGRLQFEFNGAGSPATVQLFGTGIGNRAMIKAGNDTAYTSEQVEIPVIMEIPNSLIKDGVTAISFELEMNKTILFPIGINSTIEGDNRIIKFDSVPIKNVGINEVAKLKFIVTLGNAEETTIRVRNLIPIGNDADFDVIDGNFKLLGVCKEGGERYLTGTKAATMLLSIYPNPATESIEIEYANADYGEAEVSISNYLGQTVLVQKLEKTQTGKAKLDLSQIPTGQYYLLFKTETTLENKVIQIIK